MATFAPHVTVLAQALKAYAVSANEKATRIKAATSGEDEAVKAILNSADEPTIVRWRNAAAQWEEVKRQNEAKIAEARAAAEEAAKSLAAENAGGADFNVEDATKEFLAERQNATLMRKTILALLGNDEAALQSLYEAEGITEVVSLRGSTTKGAKGVLKPRLASASVDDKAVEPSTFTMLAKTLGLPLDDVRKAAQNAAGVEDLREKAGETISFSVQVGSAHKTVVIVPKAGGNKSADGSDATDSDEDNED